MREEREVMNTQGGMVGESVERPRPDSGAGMSDWIRRLGCEFHNRARVLQRSRENYNNRARKQCSCSHSNALALLLHASQLTSPHRGELLPSPPSSCLVRNCQRLRVNAALPSSGKNIVMRAKSRRESGRIEVAWRVLREGRVSRLL